MRRKVRLRLRPAGVAGGRKRALRTSRRARQADQRPEFHHGLVEIAGRSDAGHLRLEPVRQFLAGGKLAEVVAPPQKAAEDARDIAIHDRYAFAETDAGDRGGGVGADTGESGKRRGGLRHEAVPIGNDLPCRGLQVARAGVVAESFPKLEHVR